MPKKRKNLRGKKRIGNEFENFVCSHVEKVLDMYSNLWYYSIVARASKGLADIIFTIHNDETRENHYFGIQCKYKTTGFESKRVVKETLEIGMNRHCLPMFYASGNHRKDKWRLEHNFDEYIKYIGRDGDDD